MIARLDSTGVPTPEIGSRRFFQMTEDTNAPRQAAKKSARSTDQERRDDRLGARWSRAGNHANEAAADRAHVAGGAAPRENSGEGPGARPRGCRIVVRGGCRDGSAEAPPPPDVARSA